MSDSTEQASSEKVSVTKPVRIGGAGADSARVQPPKSIDLACIAIGVTILGLAGRALGLLGSTPTLQKYLVDANRTAKNPVKNYSSHLNNDLHKLRSGTLIQSAVTVAALLLLVFFLRRTRSAGGSRWALLIIIVLTTLPFYIIPISGWPAIPKISSVIVGAGSIAALVLIFVPSSSAYFRQCREILTPPELRGKPRPGLAGLFAPRQPRAVRGGLGAARAGARPAAGTAGATRPAQSSGKNAKARTKVRSDAEATARGAELARSRAKASKSRRTDL